MKLDISINLATFVGESKCIQTAKLCYSKKNHAL